MKNSIFAVVTLLLLSSPVFGGPVKAAGVDVKAQIQKFVPVEIKVDPSLLSPRQKKLVDWLVKASRVMDTLFLTQVYDGNIKLKDELVRCGDKCLSIKEYFDINQGPYDKLDHNRPFIADIPQRPKGATFYPADMTKEELLDWIKKHPQDRAAFEGAFTVIRRKGGGLQAIPYSQEYAGPLKEAALHLRNAAKYADNATLKKYLLSRADAFLSNDYFASDVDWVHLKDHAIEVVVGPYEVYEDELFGYKAAFEAYVTRVDSVESARLDKISGSILELEEHLPVADEFKGKGRNPESPIIVTQEIFAAGDGNRGVQTIAFNLPNDEKVRKEEGSKKVMLKNVQEAKFNKILLPIAKLAIAPADADQVKFEPFFAQIMLHEISHGIGPGEITVDGRITDVNRELKDAHSVIEEAKADALGVYNVLYLTDKGLYPKEMADGVWPTYLAGIFRSIRFGIGEAHGGANVMQFNYLLDKGGISVDKKSGRFAVRADKIDKVVKDMAHALLMIEAKGDYKAAKKFIAKYMVTPPTLKKILDKLNSAPVDIRPVFEIEN